VKAAGFTLVELLIALLIFGMLSAAGVALLSFSVKTQDAADARLGELAQIRRASALLTADLAQAAPRLTRDAAGRIHPAFSGGTGEGEAPALTFVRRGWDNVDNARRPSLQKVEYRLVDGSLERRGYRHLDGAPPMAAVNLVEGVRSLRLRYRDGKGEWRDRWTPARSTDLPRAVELVLDVERGGTIRQLFLTGAGA
jgi:general secretion pathway protein J